MLTEVSIAAKIIFGGLFVFGATLIEIPEWGDANLIEIIWTAVGIGMLAVTAWALPRVVGDWVITRRVPGHFSVARTLLARGHVRREVLRMFQGMIVTAIGLYAIFQPNAVPGPAQISVFGLVLTAGLVALGALTGLQSFLDSRQRALAEKLLTHPSEG